MITFPVYEVFSRYRNSINDDLSRGNINDLLYCASNHWYVFSPKLYTEL